MNVRQITAAGLLGLIPAFIAIPARAANDSFLDAKIPNPPVPAPVSYADELKAVQLAVGKPLIFPDGFLAFLARRNPKVQSWAYDTPRPASISRREYLEEVSWNLQMDFTYDPNRGALVADFAWHKPPTRSAREVLATLEKRAITEPVIVDNHNDRSWFPIFEELLSQPENYSAAWKIWLDQAGINHCSPLFIGTDVYPLHLKDSSGADHFAVLAYFHAIMIPDPRPAAVIYLFDHDGKLEDGGLFPAGYAMFPPTFKVTPDGTNLAANLVMEGKNDFHYSVTFDGGKPSTSSWGDFNLGTPSFSYDSTTGELDLGFTSKYKYSYDLKFVVDHGKLHATLLRDGAVLSSPDYMKAGLGPFVDSLD